MEEIFENETLRHELLTSGFGLKLSPRFHSDGSMDTLSTFKVLRDDNIIFFTSFGYSKEATIHNFYNDIRAHK